jgi:hypothetical protein
LCQKVRLGRSFMTFHAKQQCWRELTVVVAFACRSAGSLVGMPGGLADTGAVVATNESGPRYVSQYHQEALLREGFLVLEGDGDGLRDCR